MSYRNQDFAVPDRNGFSIVTFFSGTFAEIPRGVVGLSHRVNAAGNRQVGCL